VMGYGVEGLDIHMGERWADGCITLAGITRNAVATYIAIQFAPGRCSWMVENSATKTLHALKARSSFQRCLSCMSKQQQQSDDVQQNDFQRTDKSSRRHDRERVVLM